MLSSLNATISTIESTQFITGHVIYTPYFTYKFQLKTTKDNSGMKFVVTQNLRPHDSGIMELGLVYTDKMAIPPGQNSFALHGYCLPQCSAVVSIHIC